MRTLFDTLPKKRLPVDPEELGLSRLASAEEEDAQTRVAAVDLHNSMTRPYKGRWVEVAGIGRVPADNVEGDDQFIPSIKKYQIIDGWLYLIGHDGHNGVVLGTKADLTKWMAAVDKENTERPVVTELWNPEKHGGAQIVKEALDMATKTLRRFGIAPIPMEVWVSTLPMAASTAGKDKIIFVNIHKVHNEEILDVPLPWPKKVGAHEASHVGFMKHPQQGHYVIDVLKWRQSQGKPALSTYHGWSGHGEGVAEAGAAYMLIPKVLEAKEPELYAACAWWFGDGPKPEGKIASTQTRVASRYLLAKALDTKRWGGFTFEIDRPKGYVKTWDQPDGSVKKYKYPVDYGYFIGHTGEDDEGLDAFVGSDPAGKIESFLKLKPSETDPDELVPDETKFLVGLTPKEREQVMSLYEPESVTEMQEYKDVYALVAALTEYRTAKKIAKQTITEDTKIKGWEKFVKTEPIKAVKMDEDFEVETLEGTMQGKANDMLAQGIEGERYVIDADIFDKTYERAKKVAARYLQVTAREEHYYVWARKFPQVSESAFGAMEQYADREGTEVNDDPKESLQMLVWDMGWQKEPLPTNKHHWVWELAAALKVDVRKEYAEGAASRGSDD